MEVVRVFFFVFARRAVANLGLRRLPRQLLRHLYQTSSTPGHDGSLSSGMSSSSSSESDIDPRLSLASDHDGGSTTVDKLVLWLSNKLHPVSDVLTNIKYTYLCHSASKVDRIRLCVAQKPDEPRAPWAISCTCSQLNCSAALYDVT